MDLIDDFFVSINDENVLPKNNIDSAPVKVVDGVDVVTHSVASSSAAAEADSVVSVSESPLPHVVAEADSVPNVQPLPHVVAEAESVPNVQTKRRTSRVHKEPPNKDLPLIEKPKRKSVAKKDPTIEKESKRKSVSKKSPVLVLDNPIISNDITVVSEVAKKPKIRVKKIQVPTIIDPAVTAVARLVGDATTVADAVDVKRQSEMIETTEAIVVKEKKIKAPKPLMTPQIAAELETLRKAQSVFNETSPDLALVQQTYIDDIVAKDLEIAALKKALERYQKRKRKIVVVENMDVCDPGPQEGEQEVLDKPIKTSFKRRKVVVRKHNTPEKTNSVLNFFAPVLKTPEEDMPMIIETVREGPTCDLLSYIKHWKMDKKKDIKTLSFFSKKNNRYLQFWEIPSKRPSQVCHLSQVRVVFIAIHDRERPPVKVLLTYASPNISGRRPLGVDPAIDYEKDSDEEWVEEHDGEDLAAEDEEEDEAAPESEADSFFVSDGHFSEDEALSEDEAQVARRLSRGSMDDEETASSPRRPGTLSLVCLGPAELLNADYLPDHFANWKTLLHDGGITVYDSESYFNYVALLKPAGKPSKPVRPSVDWTQMRPVLARFVHGKSVNIDSLVADFKAVYPDVHGLKLEIRAMAAWAKAGEGKIAWHVKPELFDAMGLTNDEMLSLALQRKPEMKEPKEPKSAKLAKTPKTPKIALSPRKPKTARRPKSAVSTLKDMLIGKEEESLSRAAIIHD